MAFDYPTARRDDVIDEYHGREVADPYRWLEDPESADTQAFVAAQNEVTEPYLAGLPGRDRLAARMTELWDFPRTGVPTTRSGVSVWAHNDGLQDQPVYYVSDTPTIGAEGRVLLDPNSLSDDGAVAVMITSLSPDGRHFAYTVSEAGSDQQYLMIRSTETGEDLDDRLDHLRFTSIAWFGDGFFYVRYPEVDPASTAPVKDPSVHYHRLGDAQADDRLVFHNDDDPEPGYGAFTTHDDRYLVLTEYLGTSQRNGLLYLPLDGYDPASDDGTERVDPTDWIRLVDHGIALHAFVVHHDDHFLVHTDLDAPNGRVIRMPLRHLGVETGPAETADGETVIPEGEAAIEWAAGLAGTVVVNRLIEASHRLDRYGLDGDPLGTIELPGPGTVAELSGRFVDPDIHIGYQSFVQPPTALTWSSARPNVEPTVFAGSEPRFDAETMVVERLHAPSSDGRSVGMFVLRRADAELPGPVELYGYGGFSISLTPMFSPARIAFVEAGGIVAVANLRGGTELGEDWHQQGMLGNKQQVFDDFAACGRHLIERGLTTTDRLGIRGGSNGGLLTAATMIQHPDLFGAVVSQVPVTDMLRYQHFTAGRYWTVEYGDAADPGAFDWLIEYSPLHNVDDPTHYPPLLITTAESDDRVVPMHSYKLAAEIQHRAGGSSRQPLLLRVETRAGHGAGKPTSKLIDESADIYGFLLHNLSPPGVGRP